MYHGSMKPKKKKKKKKPTMKVKAPDGYHWMKKGKEYKLMKDPAGRYKPHKGASKSADFAVQKVHGGKK